MVHTHTAKAGALGRAAAVLARVPVRVHTYHGHVLGGSYFHGLRTAAYRWVERALARWTHRILVLTQSQAEDLGRLLGVRRERLSVVPLGLPLEPFRTAERGPARAWLREHLDLPPQAQLVGSVGRIVPVKNHRLLLDAMARVEGAHLVVVGDGAAIDVDPLVAQARSLGLEPRVHWMGWQREIPRITAALDVMALTSHDEGTPVAVLEALAAGTRVVATAVGGVPEILDMAVDCESVDDPSPSAFATALARALQTARSHPDAALPDSVRSRVTDHFSIERLVSDVWSAYALELG